MIHYDYFPTRIYRDERPDLAQQVLPICDVWFNEVRNQTQPFCQTPHLGREVDLRQLSDYLLLSASNILREQGYMVKKYDFYVSGLWGQKIRQKNYPEQGHVQKNSQICGWFFLEVPNPGATALYYDTRINKSMIELDFEQQENIEFATSYIHFNNLQAGTVLFNNSWMPHQLTGNTSEQPTTCIYFTISHRDILCNIC
jgi:hypothetical protein